MQEVTISETSRQSILSVLRWWDGAGNARNQAFQFWRQDNHPKECFSPEFTLQKLHYIHRNPVEAGIVEKPEEYLYSSAKDYY